MFLPYRTTTPVYHFPRATVGLIAANTAIFLLSSGVPDGSALSGSLPDGVLEFGNGLHPLQWVTSIFLHEGFVHLAGNMIFLWIFGQIVEGRLGWWRFLVVYLGLGVGESALMQTLLLGSFGKALGSSGAIFGLMAMSLLWAPREGIYTWWYVFFMFGTVVVTVRTFAFIYLVLQVLDVWSSARAGEHLCSGMFHLAGAALGLIAGRALLKTDLMEHDGRDLFSLWKKKKLQGVEGEAGRAADVDDRWKRGGRERRAGALELMRGYLREGDPGTAYVVYSDTVEETGRWPLPETDLRSFIHGLYVARDWRHLKPLVAEYVRRFSAKNPLVRLILAALYLEFERRPHKALQVLRSMDGGALPPPQEKLRRDLLRAAEKEVPDG